VLVTQLLVVLHCSVCDEYGTRTSDMPSDTHPP
jgi:hypothetical protein